MTTNEYYQVVTLVTYAKSYLDVFTGLGAMAHDERLRTIKSEYRRLVRVVHPDRVDQADRDVAEAVFKTLNELYNHALHAVETDTVGVIPSKASFTTHAATHETVAKVTEWCDMAVCYKANSMIAGTLSRAFIKVAKTPTDNDLLATEAEALRRLSDGGDPKRLMFYPTLVDTFAVTADSARMRANAFSWLDGFYNLEQVKRRYPGGVDPLDAAWMWRRVLWALDYAHDRGLVHGAVLPQNIMILPGQHGVVLVDWCYASVKLDKTYRPLSAVVGRQRDWYPDTVLDKRPVVPGLDIALGARSMVYLMGGDPLTGVMPATVPRMMAAYFADAVKMGADTTVSVPQVAMRFDELLKTLGVPYYPRAFRPFAM